jgi:hypothetical protein
VHTIRDVFYERDGKIIACGEPVRLEAESIGELMALLEELGMALSLAVLTPDDVPSPSTMPAATTGRKTRSHRAVLTQLGIKKGPG